MDMLPNPPRYTRSLGAGRPARCGLSTQGLATLLSYTCALLLLAAAAAPAFAQGDGGKKEGRKEGKGGTVTVAPDPEAPGISTSQRLERLIERIKWEQARLKSMEAGFVQNKVSALLIKPEEAHGKFWYQAPDKVRWDFEKPNPTTVLVNEEEMLTWYRDLKRAERINVGKQADRVMQYLSASNSLESLQRYFVLKVSFPKDPKEPYRLELTPRFARVAKRIQSMTIHLDRAGYWPVFVKYVEPDGDSTELRFTAVKLNSTIAPDVFKIALPADVEVKKVDFGAKTGSKTGDKN
jgi:outer membrane lipoprotein carrier protein